MNRRNLTIDGVFTDGNYTFDTSGNVRPEHLVVVHNNNKFKCWSQTLKVINDTDNANADTVIQLQASDNHAMGVRAALIILK